MNADSETFVYPLKITIFMAGGATFRRTIPPHRFFLDRSARTMLAGEGQSLSQGGAQKIILSHQKSLQQRHPIAEVLRVDHSRFRPSENAKNSYDKEKLLQILLSESEDSNILAQRHSLRNFHAHFFDCCMQFLAARSDNLN